MPRGTSLADEARLQGRLWTPAALQPSAWFDAQERSTLSADGSGITVWADRSGNGRNATRITSANSPVISEFGLNGLPALAFTSDALNLPSGFLYNTANYSLAFIMRSLGSANGAFFGPTDAYGTGLEIFSYPTAPAAMRVSSGAAAVFQSGLFSVNDAAGITVITSSTSSINAWFNGSSVPYSGGGGTSGVALNYNGSYAIGRYGTSFYFNTTLGELVIFPYSLSVSEQERVTGSLAHKWKAQGALPATHPFRNRPPLIGD